jgi:hypothetical protein
MIESICIVLLFFSEFLSLIYTGERLKLYERVSRKEDVSQLTKSEQYAMVRLVLRGLLSILYIIFLIYCLFVAHLFWYSLATIVVAVITGYILHKLAIRGNSLNKRIWCLRIDAVITMLIWLGPLLEIIKVIF